MALSELTDKATSTALGRPSDRHDNDDKQQSGPDNGARGTRA